MVRLSSCPPTRKLLANTKKAYLTVFPIHSSLTTHQAEALQSWRTLILEASAMTNKLHTSQKTQEIFSSLGQSLKLQPFILSKLAIALSVRNGQLQANDFKTDNNGLELSRQVIFGDHDLLFKSLIIKNEGKRIKNLSTTNRRLRKQQGQILHCAKKS